MDFEPSIIFCHCYLAFANSDLLLQVSLVSIAAEALCSELLAFLSCLLEKLGPGSKLCYCCSYHFGLGCYKQGYLGRSCSWKACLSSVGTGSMPSAAFSVKFGYSKGSLCL